MSGQRRQFPVPSRFGGSWGGVNLLGSLRCCGEERVLEYRLLTGRGNSSDLREYLDTLAQQSQPEWPTGSRSGVSSGRHRD